MIVMFSALSITQISRDPCFEHLLTENFDYIFVITGNGDYSAYNDWVATTKDGVPNPPGTTETLTSTNCAYRISAALTYTTQLVHLLSYYLDVRLPYKIHYG